jgi:hypothetical protein
MTTEICLVSLIDCGALDLKKAFKEERWEDYVKGRWVKVGWENLETLLAYEGEDDGQRYPAAFVLQRAERYGIEAFRWAQIEPDWGGAGEVFLDRDDVERDMARCIKRNARHDPQAVAALEAKGRAA